MVCFICGLVGAVGCHVVQIALILLDVLHTVHMGTSPSLLMTLIIIKGTACPVAMVTGNKPLAMTDFLDHREIQLVASAVCIVCLPGVCGVGLTTTACGVSKCMSEGCGSHSKCIGSRPFCLKSPSTHCLCLYDSRSS